ncbi:protein fam167a-like [Plakobranchus ocellatus]|uniref:Protein fam167a-like n=1 Tax=Plakobranchus ocellatus TaxID=259542 RepID=A0AAV3Y1Y5_9GAST|nr:protein fam167a-like [Plakobranchus ocellatus]
MATAAHKQTIASGQAHNSSGHCIIEDPNLTPSQRRKRPLSIIKESDNDSDAASELLVGRDLKGNSSGSGSDTSVKKSSSRICQSTGSSAGRGAISGRVTNTNTRCSPHIKKLTDKFERSATPSPSRTNFRIPGSNTASRSMREINKTSTNNNSSSTVQSPKINSPRAPPAKNGPTLKSTRALASSPSLPATRVTNSVTTRASSPLQNSKPVVRSGIRSVSNLVNSGGKQNGTRGKAGTTKEEKRPSGASDARIKNAKAVSKIEKTDKVSRLLNTLDNAGHVEDSFVNGETENSVVIKKSQDEHSDTLNEKPVPSYENNESIKLSEEQESSHGHHRSGSSGSESDVCSTPGHGGGLARIRETAERLQLSPSSSQALPSPSNSPHLSSAAIPPFSQRLQFQAHHSSSPLVFTTPVSQSSPSSKCDPGITSSVPHIQVTDTDGKSGTSCSHQPQLGPSVLSPGLQFILIDQSNQKSTPLEADNDSNNNITTTDNVSTPVSPNIYVSNQDSINVNHKSALLFHSQQQHTHHNTTNFNYRNFDYNIHKTFPRSPYKHPSRPLSTPSLSQTASQVPPYYKLSSSAFFIRRISSGGSSFCEEDEEEGEEKENKGDVMNRKKDSHSSPLLLSERGSSVSSIGSSSPDPTSPLLPQASTLHQFSASDLSRLKETAEKLRLTTRRDSTMAWRQKYMDSPGKLRKISLSTVAAVSAMDDGKLTQDRKQRIDAALEWLREELHEMRTQDQNLARQLLTIRHDIHQLKLQRSTEKHQDLIEDFQNELEELQEFSDVLDLPQPVYEGDNPLRSIGITRLNLSARRFSAC